MAGPATPLSAAKKNAPALDAAVRHGPRRWPHLQPTAAAGGLPGGPETPFGARALYLFQGDKDTMYRIHGTNEPDKIGQNVSSGCIRMRNIDVIDLYDRVKLGTKVVVE